MSTAEVEVDRSIGARVARGLLCGLLTLSLLLGAGCMLDNKEKETVAEPESNVIDLPPEERGDTPPRATSSGRPETSPDAPRVDSEPAPATDMLAADGPPRRYHYFPHHELFYDVKDRTYTWYDRGTWRTAGAFPSTFKLNPEHAMIIELPGPHPELSIARAHRAARAGGLVPGQARGAGGAAPEPKRPAAAAPPPEDKPASEPVPEPRPETDQAEDKPDAPPQRRSLF